MSLLSLTDPDGNEILINPEYIVRTQMDLGDTTMIVLSHGYAVNVMESQDKIKRYCKRKCWGWKK